MDWIARQPLSRALLIAAAWPFALSAYAAARIARLLLRDGTFFLEFGVSSWPLLALLLVGPSLVVLAIWWLARRYRGAAG